LWLTLEIIFVTLFVVFSHHFHLYWQGKQKEAEKARSKFAGETRSDHLALLNAFQVIYHQSV